MYLKAGISSSYGGLAGFWFGATDPSNYIPKANTKVSVDGASRFFKTMIRKTPSLKNQIAYTKYHIYWNAFGPLASREPLLFKKPTRVMPNY